MTVQVPEGWKASEVQVDTCTVSWEVVDADGTASAYMNNEIMVVKSENARKTYKAYGFTGAAVDNAPVAGYLNAEEAVKQVIAPMTGASNVQVTYTDAEASAQVAQVLCIAGMAACDAKVFEAAYERKGVLMRGKYMVQAYDFGDGLSWWINIWGYTSPAADWAARSPVLENVFTSAKYTDAWASKCGQASGASSGGGAGAEQDVIGAVMKNRQDAQDRAAEAWDAYIRGE